MTSEIEPFRDGNLEYQHGVKNARGILYGLGFSAILWAGIIAVGYGIAHIFN